jgi:hypothetical protein
MCTSVGIYDFPCDLLSGVYCVLLYSVHGTLTLQNMEVSWKTTATTVHHRYGVYSPIIF